MLITNAKPVTPRSTSDPVGTKRDVKGSYNQVEERLKRVQREVLRLIDNLPKKSVTINALKDAERRYFYEVDANQLQSISFYIQQLIYDELLDNPDGTLATRWWLNSYLEKQYERGTGQALKSTQNMASSSVVGPEASQAARAVQLEGVLLTPQYQQRIGYLKSRVFENMKGLSDQMKSDLSGVLARGIANGDGVDKIKKEIVDRVGVSDSRARRITRTEISNSYTEAYMVESDELSETLWKDHDLAVRMMWYSALSPTTRITHARRHSNVYTTEECRDFWSRDGNRINCNCTVVEVLVDKNTGKVVNQELQQEERKEKQKYIDEAEKGKKETA